MNAIRIGCHLFPSGKASWEPSEVLALILSCQAWDASNGPMLAHCDEVVAEFLMESGLYELYIECIHEREPIPSDVERISPFAGHDLLNLEEAQQSLSPDNLALYKEIEQSLLTLKALS